MLHPQVITVVDHPKHGGIKPPFVKLSGSFVQEFGQSKGIFLYQLQQGLEDWGIKSSAAIFNHIHAFQLEPQMGFSEDLPTISPKALHLLTAQG